MALGKNRIASRDLLTLFNLGTIRDLTDGQLLERFATTRDEVAELAFAALIERHGPMVLRVCRGVLRDTHDAHDAFQATFFILVKKARSLWVRDSLGPWLYQVAHRTASHARVSAMRRRKHEQQAIREVAPSIDPDIERTLHDEIARLPERFRAPLVLCDLEGATHEQAARHLGWPIGTVKSRQSRGRQRLRERLTRRGFSPEAGVAFAIEPAITLPSALLNSTTTAAMQYATTRVLISCSAASLAREVLQSMSLLKYAKLASLLIVSGTTVSGIGLIGQTPSAVQDPAAKVEAVQAPKADDGVIEVKPGKFRMTFNERGNLEAVNFDQGTNPLLGESTIVFIKPEGSQVKKGDFVCELDSTILRNQLANQKIEVGLATANLEDAKRHKRAAEVELERAIDGTLKNEQIAFNIAIADAVDHHDALETRRTRTDMAKRQVEHIIGAKKDAVTPADVVIQLDLGDRLDAIDLEIKKAQNAIELERSKLDTLIRVTHPQVLCGFEASIKKADALVLEGASFLKSVVQDLAKLETQLAASKMFANQDGMVAHPDKQVRVSRGVIRSTISEGETVREGQILYTVNDLEHVVVNAKIRESIVDRLAVGQTARIKIDAFPGQTFSGKVRQIAPLPDEPAQPGQPKFYTSIIEIEKPGKQLRPGMTAATEIEISELDNVIAVPQAAVVFGFGGKRFVAVKKADGTWEWREVSVGAGNETQLEIKSGLKPGEVVAIDANAKIDPAAPPAPSGSPRDR